MPRSCGSWSQGCSCRQIFGIVYYPILSSMQVLYSEDIASISEPCERFAAEEAKRQEILTWPGVKYAEYASIGTVD